MAKPGAWQEAIKQLGPVFAERAASADEGDRFVAENFVELTERGLMAAGVPERLGGGGLSTGELSRMLREIAHSCSSSALAFSMHPHQVAINVWRWGRQDALVDGLLKRIAAERFVLLSSSGSGWLQGSGTATKVAGSFPINACKSFANGAPAGD
jgi:alkylation response protein AidB-like acyl-CoA dehydrogenase